MPAKRYLSRTEVAQRLGVAPATLARYKLPAPDVLVGDVRGWLPATIDTWDAARPQRRRVPRPEQKDTDPP